MLLYLIYLDKFHRLYSLSFERIERIAWILFFHSTFFNVILHTVSTNIKYWGIYFWILEVASRSHFFPVRIFSYNTLFNYFFLIYSFHNFFRLTVFVIITVSPTATPNMRGQTDRQTDGPSYSYSYRVKSHQDNIWKLYYKITVNKIHNKTNRK